MAREPLHLEALTAALGERWSQITIVEQTESTNADLLAAAQAPDRSLLVAEDQVAGRGRLDRSWSTPPRAGLTVSFLFRPQAPLSSWGWVPLLAGAALREAITEVTGLAADIKWPNDLLIDDAKVAGILAQTAGDAVVIGVGVNVSLRADELPVPTATSLELSGAGPVDRTALLSALARRLDARMGQWDDVRGDAAACGLAAAYREGCSTVGKQVRVSTLAGPSLVGEAVDVDDDGRLQVRVDGVVQSVGAGDVEHVRPA